MTRLEAAIHEARHVPVPWDDARARRVLRATKDRAFGAGGLRALAFVVFGVAACAGALFAAPGPHAGARSSSEIGASERGSAATSLQAEWRQAVADGSQGGDGGFETSVQ